MNGLMNPPDYKQLSALDKLAWQCSTYDDGGRACLLCSRRSTTKPFTQNHNPECPVFMIRLAIEQAYENAKRQRLFRCMCESYIIADGNPANAKRLFLEKLDAWDAEDAKVDR